MSKTESFNDADHIRESVIRTAREHQTVCSCGAWLAQWQEGVGTVHVYKIDEVIEDG